MKQLIIGKAIIGLFISLLFTPYLNAQIDWLKRGSDSTKYEMSAVGSEYKNKKILTIRSIVTDITGFGTYMQKMSSINYLGKRVRMTGYMKSDELSDWGEFWLRIDQSIPPITLAFDNMQDRSIQGTSDWGLYQIVLDVPANASSISFGAILTRTGQIWFTEPDFEIVDTSIPTTGGK
ncbi:MAG: hypothetical protein ABIO04_00705 [Ferruginibacter sp.]